MMVPVLTPNKLLPGTENSKGKKLASSSVSRGLRSAFPLRHAAVAEQFLTWSHQRLLHDIYSKSVYFWVSYFEVSYIACWNKCDGSTMISSAVQSPWTQPEHTRPNPGEITTRQSQISFCYIIYKLFIREHQAVLFIIISECHTEYWKWCFSHSLDLLKHQQ